MVSSNINHLSLPKNKVGLNIKTLKQIYVECKVSARQTLKLSRNEEVGVTSFTVYQMVRISKNGNKKKHQTVNFVKIKSLDCIYLITAQPPLNDTNGDITLSAKQIRTILSQSLLIIADCMLISTGMNVQAPYSRVKDQIKQMLKCTGRDLTL